MKRRPPKSKKSFSRIGRPERFSPARKSRHAEPMHRFEKDSESRNETHPREYEKDVAIVCGRKPIEELLRHSPGRIQRLLLLEDGVWSAEFEKLLQRIPATKRKLSPREALDSHAPGLHHQGAIAEVQPLPECGLREQCEQVKKSQTSSGIVLALDQIQDPQNFGALLRVADAAGVDFVLYPDHRSVSLSPVVRRISAGASEFIPVCRVTNLAQGLRELKREGYWIIGSGLSDTAQDLYHTELPHPIVLVLGAEGRGMRELTRSLCDIEVKLPMDGVVQSLNVAQAGAAVLFELLRRRFQNAPVP